MDNQQRTRFMNDWIRAQEQVRQEQETAKKQRNRQEEDDAKRQYNKRSTDASGDSKDQQN